MWWQCALSCRFSNKCKCSQACWDTSARRDSGIFRSHIWMYLFSSEHHCCLWYLAWKQVLGRVVEKRLGCWALGTGCWWSSGAGRKICCHHRMQEPLHTSSLWLWIKWRIYLQKYEQFTSEFVMIFLNYGGVYVAFLVTAFFWHKLTFLKLTSLLTEPRPTCPLSHVFRSIPLVNQGKSSALKADVTANELVCLTFLFYMRRELDVTKGETYPSPQTRAKISKFLHNSGEKKILGGQKGCCLKLNKNATG